MSRKLPLAWLAGLGLSSLVWMSPSAFGQVSGFEDNFESDPQAADRAEGVSWKFFGSTLWVPPGADECRQVPGDPLSPPDPNNVDPLNPCTLYSEDTIEERLGIDAEDFGGYLLVTSGGLNLAGNAFQAVRDEDGELQPVLYDNFKMTVVVELRDGTVGQPADGMCVVIVEQQPPADRNGDGAIDEFEAAGMPGVGAGGGAMGATGLGPVKTMIFEFDDWSCNTGDNNNDNHVGFAWEAGGFPAVDAIPNDTFVPIAPAQGWLHNRQAPTDFLGFEGEERHVDPNRWEMTVFVQSGVVACRLRSLDGVPNQPGGASRPTAAAQDLGVLYTYEIPNYEAFQGFLGVTAGTGAASQNQILHFASIEDLGDTCIRPPGSVARVITPGRDASQACGDYADGDTVAVTLRVVSVRPETFRADGGRLCPAASRLVINEVPPAGWRVDTVSAGGVANADGSITWDLSGARVVEGAEVSYTVIAADDGNVTASFSGSVAEGTTPTAREFQATILGQSTMKLDQAYDLACGGISCWNILGPYLKPGGAAPGEDIMRSDFLTDGEQTELDFVWFPGAQIATDYNGAAASTGLAANANGRNPNGVPTVVSWNDSDSWINLNDDVYGGDPNEVMGYAQVYINNDTGDDWEGQIAMLSDDAIQVLINGEEVWINNVARGSAVCTFTDIAPDFINFLDPILLTPGDNEVLVKVYEGGGGWNFSFKFQDEDGNAVTDQDGLLVSKYPEGVCPVPPLVATRLIETGAEVLVETSARVAWETCTQYTVNVELTDVRGNLGGNCGAATDVTVREVIPEGWTIDSASDGGQISGRSITWRLTGANVRARRLSYAITTDAMPRNVSFSGAVTEPGSPIRFPFQGVQGLGNPGDYQGDGFISSWLLLGPYIQPGGLAWGPFANPNLASIQRDLLATNDGINQFDIEPRDLDETNTNFRGASPSPGLGGGTRTPTNNPDGVPTWRAWNDFDDTIEFESYYGGNVDNVMMYAVTYVLLEEDMTVDLGLGSDDSIQVLLDGEEIWINSIARGSGGANVVQDIVSSLTTPALDPLPAGLHKIMVKVYEGGGGHNFRLRFQDPATGEAITEGIAVCLDPEGDGCDTPSCDDQPAGFVRGDSDASGTINLADGIQILNFLFQGGPAPACLDAADTDNGGSLQLTDGVRIFNYLFTGGAAPAAPSPRAPNYDPADCGPDTGATLGCERPAAKCS